MVLRDIRAGYCMNKSDSGRAFRDSMLGMYYMCCTMEDVLLRVWA
jgi:hypothetical protein